MKKIEFLFKKIILFINKNFCSTLSEFENFLLCERILINVKTKRQANFKDFKPFGAFKGLVEQKNVVFNSLVCKLGSFWHSWNWLNNNLPLCKIMLTIVLPL
jgi:hypothetical protein